MKPAFPLDFLRNMVVRVRRALRPNGVLALIVAIALLPAAPVRAAWNSAAETIANHPVWIYSPASTMSNGKHGLLVVLHGCAQSHDDIKNFGNLEPTAENNALVVAVPSVGAKVYAGNQVTKCWDYDGASDKQGHIAEIVQLVAGLAARGELSIDPDQVYVAGLSSGAALALDVACRAPDVFAGVAALAGPSVGSNQGDALKDRTAIPANNVDHAVSTCRSLAGNKAAAFATQIAIIAYGAMDLDGPNEKYRFQSMMITDRAAHAGQLALVSVQWSKDNVEILRQLYGADALGQAVGVQGDFGVQQLAAKNGKRRISQLVVNNVGHAWPAGSGRPNVPSPGGLWIAQSGLNYADYLATWLIANNLRAKPAKGPELSVLAAVQNRKILVSGSAKNRDGSRSNVATALLKAESKQAVDNHSGIAVKADGSYADVYQNVQDGRYMLQVTARDNAGNSSTRVSGEVTVGQPPPPPPSHCFTDNNYNHVRAGRAQQCSSGFACATGSGDNLGLYNLFVTSSVVESPAGFFRKGMCPVP